MQSKAMGYKGEKLAAHYLKAKGYQILQSNFTVQGGEIDLIAKHKGVLVFVEVKARTCENFGTGDERITRLKKRNMQTAIGQYINRFRRDKDIDYRIDVVEIEFDPQGRALKNITHFEDIEV